MHRVGVVIPTFNSGLLLREAVDSVLNQTEAVDLVIVDDCSTDEASVAVLAELEAQGLHVLRHDVNTGPGGSMNSGIRLLENPYVVAVAADDVADPEYAHEAAEVLERDPSVSVVTTALQKFGASSELYVPEGAPNGVTDLLFYNTVPGISMFRREDWERIGGYASLTWGEDYDFWIRLLHAVGGTCFVLPTPRYRYRIHDDQLTSTRRGDDKIAQQVEMVRRHPDPWRDNIDVVMERLWRNQAELDYYRSSYGKINYVKNVLLNRVRTTRDRLLESRRSRQRVHPGA
ncbi:glycosyltransferase family 2 protein [Nocardioides currus]|uniref:Glycosyltransferase family 2 protein n=1 Tax=Nocardioides currus TaxID=2133958 RepID=A0A2R7YYU5_9ACTN|nr:glycosyltransferase family A protein [Nocardioides currus]PUA81533.1 hypothetical protein C7S10_05485 [Nocardioides currus]